MILKQHAHYFGGTFLFRAFSAFNIVNSNLGRCPRLFHFAPSVLEPALFHTVFIGRGSVAVLQNSRDGSGV
jgi:hypothetical protein